MKEKISPTTEQQHEFGTRWPLIVRPKGEISNGGGDVCVTFLSPLCAHLSLQKHSSERNEIEVKPESVFQTGEQYSSGAYSFMHSWV